MPKNRNTREEKAPERTFTINGGPCTGYTICHKGQPLVYHFEKMWDAIGMRDKFLSGELKISQTDHVEAATA